MIRAFHHTSFTVADLQRSVDFWSRVLGFEALPSTRRDAPWAGRAIGIPGAALRTVHLRGYGHTLELMQFDDVRGSADRLQPHDCGAGHICLVVDDIEGVRQAIVAGGGRAQGEIVTIGEEPRKGCKVVYLRDPNGLLIELIEMPA
jgi:catechol 2,3-dioxygenase-like lactoylglutathione lyase family enzyme